jgi:hypothetical protein
MKSEKNVIGQEKNLFAIGVMFFILGVFSIVLWSDVSLAEKMGMFVLGFGSGRTRGILDLQAEWIIGSL